MGIFKKHNSKEFRIKHIKIYKCPDDGSDRLIEYERCVVQMKILGFIWIDIVKCLHDDKITSADTASKIINLLIDNNW